MQDGRKAVWSILYVSVAFFPSLKHNFIAYNNNILNFQECTTILDACKKCLETYWMHHVWPRNVYVFLTSVNKVIYTWMIKL